MIIFKNLLIISIIFFISSCANYKKEITKEKITKKEIIEKKYFTSKGFALIYDDTLIKQGVIKKKLKNDKFYAIHSKLSKNTRIKIINPINSKFVEINVYKKNDYPRIFNIIINQKIANYLDLDRDNPYVELFEIKENETFIAKESNIFDEERSVAENAPVDEVKVDDLSVNKDTNSEKKKLSKTYNFILIVSDFYYQDSANTLKKELIKKTKNINFSVKKISINKYRLSAGPFKNFNSLKSLYISLNNLGFDDLNIYRQ